MKLERTKIRHLRQRAQGQVVVEYVLAMTIVAAIGAMLFIFYQGFVQGNLYGSAGDLNENFYFLPKGNSAFGLEKVVSLPVP